jgi:N6-adenosine-specific RNA methylase IME4
MAMSQKKAVFEAAVLESIRAQARRSAVHMLKRRARDYSRRPLELENLYPGLAAASADLTIAIAEHLLARQAQLPQRWFGFGGEVKQLNAKAALLLGRYRRRHDHR